MFADLIHNIALLIALTVALQLLTTWLDSRSKRYQIATGLLFGSVSIIGMMTPLHFSPGVIYDGRSIVLGLAGLFGGPLTAVVAALIAGLYRASLGGAGAVAGVLTILEASVLGTLLHLLRRRREDWVSPLRLWIFGVLVHLIMLALQLFIPGRTVWSIAQTIGLPILVFYPLAFLLIAMVFLNGEERRKTETALKASEENYRLLAENSTDWIFQIKPDLSFGYVSPSSQWITGYSSKEFRDNPGLFLEIIHPEDKGQVASHLQIDREETKAQILEFRIITKTGQCRWISHSCFPVHNDAGRYIGRAAIHQDITMRKTAEEDLQRLNVELEQKVRERTAQLEAINMELEGFTYSVSHDLKAPLRHLNGFVNLLEKNTLNKLNEKERHYVQVISESALKLDRQLKDILSFSRMGRAEMNCSRIDLNLLLEEALTLVEPEWENREIIWFRSPLPLVSGDPTMLLTVLVNLISNALKFTSREQQTIITIGHHPDDPDEVIVFIRDNGVGFNMQYQDKLFNLFQRLHPESNFAGTGLGLANMRRIITRHGGRVWAEGKEGEGATFYFSLPKTRANE